VPLLLRVLLPSRYYADGQRLLAPWDYSQPADSAAAAYFNAVWSNLLRLTFHDEMRESQWPDGDSRWFAVVSRLLRQPANSFWDDRGTDVVETRDDILTQALTDARDEMTRLQARRPDSWEWGRMLRLDLHSQTLGESGIGPVEWLFNRDGWKVGGGGSIVNATGWDAGHGYEVTSAPSMRMVVSLADFDDSRWINLSGASGHAFHPHFTDQADLYVAGRTLPWAWSHDAVDAAGEDTLTLVPAPS
jgi:penicillin amidase